MCAICGFFAPEPSPVAPVLEMLGRTSHRGPDSSGIYWDGQFIRREVLDELRGVSSAARGRIALGHARLEIVGGPEGKQPLSGCRPGWAIVANGEIYNHHELRRFLDGHPTETDSDSELILHLIEEAYRGDLARAVQTTMPMLDGMYAFAVTDGRQLVVARDPVGKKPLYFTEAGIVAFASERKALTGFDTPIHRLVPGGILALGDGHPSYRVFRTPRFQRPPLDITDFDEALEAYASAFRRAVDKRVRGLRRVGVLFSGGVDSLMVAVAARQAGADVAAFCVGMEGSDDLEAARKAAEELDLNVYCLDLTESTIESVLPEVIERIELNGLVQIEAAIPMYLAARLCAEDGHKVMLSGQAADELFAGYSWYGDVVRDHGYVTLHERLWDDIEQLYLDTLEREDRMTMAHSLELRAPFLDRDVIRTAMRMIPQGLKLDGPDDHHRKLVHRRLALECGIPRELAYREKSRAQDGTGIHQSLQRIARRHQRTVAPSTRPAAKLLDYGSNYRYITQPYAGDEVHAYIVELTARYGIGSLGTADEENYACEVMAS
jgi:asparagine synthase (glutamine-hydrolysing)